ncbi:MAG: ribonuclease P protein component [Elainellaceae cyanobacterium]
MALPSVHRLKRRQEFDRIYRRGKRLSAHHFVLRTLRQTPDLLRQVPDSGSHLGAASRLAPSKVGVAVSLKVSKRAVVRNRIRRQVQAAVKQLLPRMSGGWLIVISARSAAAECDYWQFLGELEQLLTRAEVIHGHSGRGVL